MNEKEILKGLRNAYFYIDDIVENEYKQINSLHKQQLKEMLKVIDYIYYDVYRDLDSDDLTINIANDFFGRLSDSASFDYMYYDEDIDSWNYLNYYELTSGYDWKQDNDFVEGVE